MLCWLDQGQLEIFFEPLRRYSSYFVNHRCELVIRLSSHIILLVVASFPEVFHSSYLAMLQLSSPDYVQSLIPYLNSKFHPKILRHDDA